MTKAKVFSLVTLGLLWYIALIVFINVKLCSESLDASHSKKIEKFDNVVLVNYAGSAPVYFVNRSVLNISASVYGISTIYSYSPKDLDYKFNVKNAHILSQKRGAGYWLWKPYIILDAMQKTKEGNIILYMDTDCLLKNNITNLIDIAKKHKRVLFENFHSNRQYVKRDAYILMDSDNEDIYNQMQIDAGYLMLVNNKENRDFVKKWLEYSEDERILTDIPSSLGKELPEFEDHRHEQAILTLLASKHKDQITITRSERKRYILNYSRANLFDSLVRLCIYVQGIVYG